MRVISCPPGYVILRDPDRPEDDACVACPPRFYSTEQANFSSDAGALVVRKEVEATSLPWCCLPCPKGSDCTGGAHVEPKANYWRGSPMWCLVHLFSLKSSLPFCDPTLVSARPYSNLVLCTDA